MSAIKRIEYLEELKKWKDKNLIKVVTGIRRCGKSTLLELFIEYLKEEKIDEGHIVSINLESLEFNFSNYKDLYFYVVSKIKDDKKYHVFLDEIQNIEGFQKAVDSLYIKKNIDIYITGSNTFLLSGELATLLTGRYVEIKMLPLSFKEYVSAFPGNNNYQSLFLEYMKNGGMPGTISVLDLGINDINKYLDSIFSTVVFKDIMARNKITDKTILENIIKLILENIVYLELLRRGYRVYVLKVDDQEIDFVVENQGGLKYFQVSLTVRDAKVLERELRSLQRTGDHYPKYLKTMDMDLSSDYDGITKINVIDWLLEK